MEAIASHHIAIALFPGFSLLGMLNFTEALRSANMFSGQLRYSWDLLSPDGQPLVASNGMTLNPTGAFDHRQADMWLVHAAFGYERFYGSSLRGSLHNAQRKGSVIAGSDLGPFLLAKWGLLTDRKATTHWTAIEAFKEEFPEVNVRTELFMIDGDRWTCAGAAAMADFAIFMINQREGQAMADQVKNWLIHDRAVVNVQTDGREHPGVRFAPPEISKAIEIMSANICEPLSIPEIAELINTSARTLERAFVRHTGHSPKSFYVGMRLQRARSLLQNTEICVTEIAVSSGFNSAQHFSASYASRFGRSPSADRAEITRRWHEGRR
jgi:AraC family carnitine catabolism transcriptional activator